MLICKNIVIQPCVLDSTTLPKGEKLNHYGDLKNLFHSRKKYDSSVFYLKINHMLALRDEYSTLNVHFCFFREGLIEHNFKDLMLI